MGQNFADILLRNGLFITMDPVQPRASALAIKRETIAWVGDEDQSDGWIGPETNVIDLKGAYVYPGFIDSHAHIFYAGYTKAYQLNLVGMPDKESVLQKVKERAETLQPGEWLVGIGWDESCWQAKVLPTKADLDSVCPNLPVFLRRIDGHAAWVNSKALAIGGLDKLTPEPHGGKIYRDSDGNPTGILVDKAISLLYPYMPTTPLDDTIHLCQTVLEESAKLGITMIHNAATFEAELEAYKTLAAIDAMPVRVYAMVVIPSTLGESMLLQGPQTYGPFFEVRCLKFFMDGALGSRGAALSEPYADSPEHRGFVLWQESELTPILEQAKKNGFQVAFHAIGDLANHLVLDAYENIDVKELRWRIEHAQILTQADIGRFASLGVIAAMQPLHLAADMPWLEDRVGADRAKMGAFAFRTLLDDGAMIAAGSDAPIVDSNPLWGMYTAITRQDLQGKPEGGWYPEQRVSREEALRMYTLDAAYATFREHELGSLTQGKLADLVILPENLLSCDVSAFIDMQVLCTIVHGKIRYQSSRSKIACSRADIA